MRARKTHAAALLVMAVGCPWIPACGVDKRQPGVIVEPPNRKVDVLFVIPTFLREWLPVKVRQRVPRFMETLASGSGGIPDLHLGIVSDAMGAGAVADLPGCMSDGPGDQDGRLQTGRSPCDGLAEGARFLSASADGAANNFTGDIGTVVACMMALDSHGCSVPQPLAAARRALERASRADDPHNGGFLRADATLAVLIVSNVDDCSLPEGSTLFEAGTAATNDPAGPGPLTSYRCAEFGHLCEGQPPPHTVSERVGFGTCVPAEERGRLVPIARYLDFFRALKPAQPERVIVSAIAGPTSPYVVEPDDLLGIGETWPRVAPSCLGRGGGPEWAVPGVRIHLLTTSLGGWDASTCEDDYAWPMEGFARDILKRIDPTPPADAAGK